MMFSKFIEKLNTHKICTTKDGTETLSHFVSTLWNLVPNEYKTIASFVDFKAKTKICPCRLCKTYFKVVCVVDIKLLFYELILL